MALFSAQRLVAEQFFDPTFTFTAPVVGPGQPNPLRPVFRQRLAAELAFTLIEYDAMMLGEKSAAVKAMAAPTPHFSELTDGVTFTEVSFTLLLV
jgi:hypothetical protein